MECLSNDNFEVEPVSVEDITRNTATAKLSKQEVKRRARERWLLTPNGTSANPLFWDRSSNQTGVTLAMVDYCCLSEWGHASGLRATDFVPVAAWTTYRPHKSDLIQKGGYVVRNTWRSPHERVDVVEADVAPLLDFLALAFPREPKAVEYLLDTLAFRAQMREVPRQELMICLYSPDGATGKGAFFDVIDYAFGPESYKRTDFRSAFKDMNSNENWERNFLMLDETTVHHSDMAEVRASVSARTQDSNAKGLGSIRYETIAIPVLASNVPPSLDHPTARRTLLLRSYLSEQMDLSERAKYLTEFKTWVREHGHLIYNYLLTRDVSNYAPWGDVPETAERKARESVTSLTPALSLAKRLDDTPDHLVFSRTALQHEGHGLAYHDKQMRHELIEAGLNPDGATLRAAGSLRIRCYTREGYEFQRNSKGSWDSVRHLENGTVYPIAEDGGWLEITSNQCNDEARTW